MGALTLQITPLGQAVAERCAERLLAMNRGSAWDTWDIDALLADRPEKWQLSLLAIDRDELKGYAVVSRRDDSSVHVHHLVVDASARNAGIGSAIMRTLVDTHGETVPITLKVQVENLDAFRFYRRLGFDPIGSTPSGYIELRRDPAPAPVSERSRGR